MGITFGFNVYCLDTGRDSDLIKKLRNYVKEGVYRVMVILESFCFWINGNLSVVLTALRFNDFKSDSRFD